MIRVLIVDDSAFMRRAIGMALERESDMEVVGTASNGVEAVEQVQSLRPDVVTMDVKMPGMDGIEALKQIMATKPCPVVMISSLTQKGAQATLEALEAGAIDFISKQFSRDAHEVPFYVELVQKIRTASQSRLKAMRSSITTGTTGAIKASSRSAAAVTASSARLLAIGVSTGGPFALQQVIPLLPKDFPIPVAIVQHMPPHFTRSLAERLDSLSPLNVVEAEPGMRLEPGRVLIAPGGKHLIFRVQNKQIVAATKDGPISASGHCPSVDVMFESAAEYFGGNILSLVMTGMGKDGLDGAMIIKQKGGKVIAQSEETCVVYGMPKAIVDAGIADAIVPLDKLGMFLTNAVGNRESRVALAKV